jgi:hypothetical protein
MADSNSGSELSEIPSGRFRVLEEFYDANYQEQTEGPKLEDELDDQGISAAEIASARSESSLEQDCRVGYSTILRSSGSVSCEVASELDNHNDQKRKRSQECDGSPTKRRRDPPESLTIQDQQSERPAKVCVEIEVMEMPKHHLAKLISPTALQSVTHDRSKSIMATAQPSTANPSLSHDLEQIADGNHVVLPDSSVTRIKPAESPLRRKFEDSSQESGDLQSSNQGINIASKDVDHSKGLSHLSFGSKCAKPNRNATEP